VPIWCPRQAIVVQAYLAGLEAVIASNLIEICSGLSCKKRALT